MKTVEKRHSTGMFKVLMHRLKSIKLHLRVFLLLKVSNIFHYWPLSDFDHI